MLWVVDLLSVVSFVWISLSGSSPDELWLAGSYALLLNSAFVFLYLIALFSLGQRKKNKLKFLVVHFLLTLVLAFLCGFEVS